MNRLISQALHQWRQDPYRKPLILRGARQIGKTTVIRKFGKSFDSYIEINFEKDLSAHEIFSTDLAAERLITDLQLLTGQLIEPGKTLLFLDEVQACPKVLIALRYFYEECPKLHVIAAGSLLNFAIDEVGIPVGRVSFLHMYPMSFIEFLWALKEEHLAENLLKEDPKTPLAKPIHEKALRLVGEYMAIGGMPEAVYRWCETKDYRRCLEVHHDLLAAYKQDFHKYATKSQIKYVDHLFTQIPFQVGKKFKYAQVSGNFRKRDLAPALELLKKANIVTAVTHTSGHGLPLGAQSKTDDFKLIMLDIALMQALLGVTAEDWILKPYDAFINKGVIAEAFVGQELLVYSNSRQSASLYYWHREKQGSEAEVDYLTVQKNKIIPVEVKAGKGTTLKSLISFLESHPESPYGIRYSTHNYSKFNKIYSYPLYAVAAGY